jgi:hypothetical protein
VQAARWPTSSRPSRRATESRDAHGSADRQDSDHRGDVLGMLDDYSVLIGFSGGGDLA